MIIVALTAGYRSEVKVDIVLFGWLTSAVVDATIVGVLHTGDPGRGSLGNPAAEKPGLVV